MDGATGPTSQPESCLPVHGNAILPKGMEGGGVKMTRGSLRLPGQVGHGTVSTSLKGKGHPPLIMLDQRHPYTPAEDGGRGFPGGTTATPLSEGEGQCQIQLLHERAVLAMSDPHRFTAYQINSELL